MTIPERGLSWFIRTLGRFSGVSLGTVLPATMLRALVAGLCERDPQPLAMALGAHLNRRYTLDSMPWDLPVEGRLEFEHFAGLFASTLLDHGVISMTVRQAAYVFGLVRQTEAAKVIEVGRYKGGSTILIAAAMNGQGQFWSIDIGEKEERLYGNRSLRPFDEQISDKFSQLGLTFEMIVGDSYTLDIDTGEVDLVLIDGDHSYEGVKNDFERFGRRVRVGGAVLFDDAFGEPNLNTPAHKDAIGKLVSEITAGGDFALVKKVDRMAHLERRF